MFDLRGIAKTLALTKDRSGWYGPCPSCHYSSGFTLSEDQGKILPYCHAGGCSFAEIMDELIRRGLWRKKHDFSKPYDARVAIVARVKPGFKKSASDFATVCYSHEQPNSIKRLWAKSLPAKGTTVEFYLKSRGINLIPESIRYLPNFIHPSGKYFPVMLSAIVPWQGEPVLALHRTYLKADGSGKIDDPQDKMFLRKPQDGSIHLSTPTDTLGVCEGIENGLSALQETGIPVWAGLSTAGLKRMNLPESVRKVIIFCDNDEPGLEAANSAALRWWGEGKQVELRKPPPGKDFNDELMETLSRESQNGCY